MKSRIITTACLFLTAMIWGFAFVAQFYGAGEVGDFAMNGLRFPLGTLSLLPVMLIFERGKSSKTERKKTVLASLYAGTALFIASTLQQVGISVSKSVGISGFLTGLYTIFVPIACYLFFKKKTGFNIVVSAVLAVLGIFMLCIKPGVGFSFGFGELLLLIGAFFWTAHVVVVDRCGKDIRSLHFCVGQFFVCSVWSVLLMVIFEMPTIDSIRAAAIPILYAGVLSVGVAYTLQVIGQKRADPTFASIIFSTESVFSAIGGVIFGIDSISFVGYIGCLLIFAGIVISQLDFKKKKARPDGIVGELK
ncbi:MAG: DMT family transporter [Clostridia bacterium]|nr:DMT family transporter [Clostridia bacterium]